VSVTVSSQSASACPLLQLKGVSKRYGATVALNGVDFDLRAGEVHALMGENGAGKSTLMKILAGIVDRDTGRILIDGQPADIASPRDAASLGIAIIHQELNTVPSMTVAENLALGREPRTRWGHLDRRAMVAQARTKLTGIGCNISPRQRLESLSVGMQQMVEIARAVSEDARILVMDEPTAALSMAESRQLYEVIEERRRCGVGIIYISHRMEEVWKLADRITVFRDGGHVATRQRAEVTPNEIVRLMVGRPLTDLFRPERVPPGDTVLQVENLTARGIGPVNMSVRSGEVVALAGLIGSGRSELARLIFGADRASGGRVMINGRAVRHDRPDRAIAGGIAMLPESRKEQALFLDHSVENNIAICSLGRLSTGGVLRRSRIAHEVTKQMRRLHIRENARRQPVRDLSGGNQQKAALARWLMRDAPVVILDEPTRGVDIGAKSEIYDVINELRRRGSAVLLISSELPEAIGVSDRVLVMRGGLVVAEFESTTVTEEDVMVAATGTSNPPRSLQRQPSTSGATS
jgi:ribose transport system ATP-binding protein